MIKLDSKKCEVLCSKCNGKSRMCDKCFGTGKLDWIENIVGKKPKSRIIQGNWTVSVTGGNYAYDYDLKKQMMNLYIDDLVKQLDQKLLESFSVVTPKIKMEDL